MRVGAWLSFWLPKLISLAICPEIRVMVWNRLRLLSGVCKGLLLPLLVGLVGVDVEPPVLLRLRIPSARERTLMRGYLSPVLVTLSFSSSPSVIKSLLVARRLLNSARVSLRPRLIWAISWARVAIALI
jgi:hypothetical protein